MFFLFSLFALPLNERGLLSPLLNPLSLTFSELDILLRFLHHFDPSQKQMTLELLLFTFPSCLLLKEAHRVKQEVKG